MEQSNLPQIVARRDSRRLQAYAENISFFAGRQWQGRQRRGERRLTFNYVRALLEKVTSYMASGGAIAMEPVEASDDGMARARQAEIAIRRASIRTTGWRSWTWRRSWTPPSSATAATR